jgi:bacterioferritin-associated ferredoxin
MVRIIDYIDLHDRLHLQPHHRERGRTAARCGAKTPEDAYACQGCEIQCGCCLDYAQEVIDEERGKPPHLRLVTSRAA